MRFITLFAALAAICQQTAWAVPSAQTANGLVTGEDITVNGKVIEQFLGIPYAKPPTGDLRFKRTEAVENWDTLNATQWPAMCIQTAANPLYMTTQHMLNNTEMSEDCLFLNIWAPAKQVDCKKPVMIFVHGGAFISGTASLDLYNGEMLAANSDSIIVTINYRLGLLGFLYSHTNKETYPGNLALYDQLEAMKWVKANIDKFGGDPEQITLVGESAGSWAVSAHILSPLSRPYFNQAILQSGSVLSPWAINTPEQFGKDVIVGIQALFTQFCPFLPNKTLIDDEVIGCLNQMPVEFVDATLYMLGLHPLKLFYPLIVSPSEFLPKRPKEALESGDYKTDINLLVSTVENEGALWTMFLSDSYTLLAPPASVTLPQAKTDLKNYVEAIFGPYPATTNNYYFTGMSSLTNENRIRRVIPKAVGEAQLACATTIFGRMVFENSNKQAKVYEIRFSSSQGLPKMWCAPWAAACHGDDLFPTFAYPIRHQRNTTQRERDIADEYSKMFKHFLRTGAPGKTTLLHPYKPYFKVPLVNVVEMPYREIGDSLSFFGLNHNKDRCDAVWKQYLNF